MTANIVVSTVYESISASAIDCAGFVIAVEQGLSVLPGFTVIEKDQTKEYFFVDLGFDEIDSRLRAVSLVLGFHSTDYPELGADFYLQQYTGHFSAGEESISANSLVASLHEELKKRVAEGWLEP